MHSLSDGFGIDSDFFHSEFRERFGIEGFGIGTKVVHRHVGGIKTLRSMPEAQINAFYQRCKELSSEEIRAVMARTVTATKFSKTKFALQGKYLPLAVWEKDGVASQSH